ncbi:MAG TPA: MaoC family dehydratase N-terminal domain-containing protein [Pseudomonadales bacterium]|nr:MaoC family dehydratase N-terminal domain-containing protein [Pseudomonadales bacterium]
MSEAADTLVTQEMIDRKGIWGGERTSPPISESDIRKWAIATYWPETPPKIYWDADYAKSTKYGGIIAPADFNPFAWPVERPARPQGGGGRGGGRTGLNGGQTDTYGVPMRPGDVITSRTRLKDWNERQGRMGLTLYTYTETEWRNQGDELVRTRISIGVRY